MLRGCLMPNFGSNVVLLCFFFVVFDNGRFVCLPLVLVLTTAFYGVWGCYLVYL